MSELTPAAIVAELDRYIVGQDDAKRAVAIALRNRWRRQQLVGALRDEVQPKNILMIGPTGVGKTEIARRVSRIVNAPFLKVEATSFTEVGYVGRDVDAIVRDLVDVAITMIHTERLDAVRERAEGIAVERLVDLLIAQDAQRSAARARKGKVAEQSAEHASAAIAGSPRRRKKVAELLSRNALEDETVEIDIESDVTLMGPHVEIVTGVSPDALHDSVREFIDAISPRKESRRVTVRDARRILAQQEAQRLVERDSIVESAVERVETSGVVFIDEIDKTIHAHAENGPDVSGEGVQRDLLPIVEGSVVMTRYGPVRTDHILFIAAGSFSSNRPSDLIPELQGRFPLRVELAPLDEDDLYAILGEPENALTRQYVAMLETEGVTLRFEEDGLREIARLAAEVNLRTEDIGARRLATIVERVLEDISFEAPARRGETLVIDSGYVAERVGELAADDDLSGAIL